MNEGEHVIISLTYFAVLDRSPLEVLHIDGNCEERGEKNDSLQSVLLSLVMLRFRSPRQESDDVFCHLARSCRSTW